MALQNFITTVLSANIMQSLRKSHVFASVASQEYNGVLRNLGDKVKVNQISDITINSFTRATDITIQDLDDAALELIADQANYFSFSSEDVEAMQSKAAVMQSSADQAAYGLADAVDRYFAGLYAQAGLTSYATGTTPWDVTSLNVEDVLLDVKEKMARVPKQGRYIICPEWFHNKLILAGLASKQDNNAIFTNGLVDKVMGFDILVSENVSAATGAPTWDQSRIFAGVRGQSLSFAEALVKVEAFRPEKRFSDAVKGIHVYGGKVMRPDMTCVVYANKTAEA
jgi:hypothetical protein